MKKFFFEFPQIDKWTHVLACVLIVYVVADAYLDVWKLKLAVATAISVFTTEVFSFGKKLLDCFRDGRIDSKVNQIGILIGAVLVIAVTLCN